MTYEQTIEILKVLMPLALSFMAFLTGLLSWLSSRDIKKDVAANTLITNDTAVKTAEIHVLANSNLAQANASIAAANIKIDGLTAAATLNAKENEARAVIAEKLAEKVTPAPEAAS